MPGHQPWPGQVHGAPPGGTRTAPSAVVSLILGVLAILALVCGTGLSSVLPMGISSVVGGVFTVGPGIAAIVTGAAALRTIRRGAATGNGLAITGLLLGLAAVALVLTVAAVAAFLVATYG
jgi:hypothetical protein